MFVIIDLSEDHITFQVYEDEHQAEAYQGKEKNR